MPTLAGGMLSVQTSDSVRLRWNSETSASTRPTGCIHLPFKYIIDSRSVLYIPRWIDRSMDKDQTFVGNYVPEVMGPFMILMSWRYVGSRTPMDLMYKVSGD